MARRGGWSMVDKLRSIMDVIGPGAFIAIGYMDPGNWETSLSAGSKFGYMCLFCILMSNFCAMFLQANAVKLGLVTGFDLAQQTRRHFNRSLNYLFYISAEVAIIACDIAEVIGSAVALDLLFNIGIIPGILITGLDVFIILLGFDLARIKPFEILVLIVVITIGLCFAILIVSSKPDFFEVLEGFLPSKELVKNRSVLNLFVAIIGATVMPHNLYLHTYLVQSKFPYRDPGRLFLNTHDLHKSRDASRGANDWDVDAPLQGNPKQKSPNSDVTFARKSPSLGNEVIETIAPVNSQAQSLMLEDPENTGSSARLLKVKKFMTRLSELGERISPNPSYGLSEFTPSNLHNEPRLVHHNLEARLTKTMKYLQIDSTVSLTYAFFISVSILVVAASAFSKIEKDRVIDLITAYHDLAKTLGPAIAVVYGIALLLSGQSSTITGTIAGQAVMCGHLGEEWGKIVRPWIRRLVTRTLAIVPAVVCTVIMGSKSVNTLLIISQVILSIQLPLAMWPMVWMTSREKTMQVRFFKRSSDNGNAPIPNTVERNKPCASQPRHSMKQSTTQNCAGIEVVKTVSYHNGKFLTIALVVISSVITILDALLIYQAIFPPHDE